MRDIARRVIIATTCLLFRTADSQPAARTDSASSFYVRLAEAIDDIIRERIGAMIHGVNKQWHIQFKR